MHSLHTVPLTSPRATHQMTATKQAAAWQFAQRAWSAPCTGPGRGPLEKMTCDEVINACVKNVCWRSWLQLQCWCSPVQHHKRCWWNGCRCLALRIDVSTGGCFSQGFPGRAQQQGSAGPLPRWRACSTILHLAPQQCFFPPSQGSGCPGAGEMGAGSAAQRAPCVTALHEQIKRAMLRPGQ